MSSYRDSREDPSGIVSPTDDLHHQGHTYVIGGPGGPGNPIPDGADRANGSRPASGYKLSEMQKDVLYCLWWANQVGEEEDFWGVRWLRIRSESPTRAQSAAYSRAVRRLEQRGILVRRNQYTGRPRRLTHLALTDLGRVTVRGLAEEEGWQAECETTEEDASG
jgi:hypothetical protein